MSKFAIKILYTYLLVSTMGVVRVVRVRIAALVYYMGLHGILVYYKHGTTWDYMRLHGIYDGNTGPP